jgi:hypothetical protein
MSNRVKSTEIIQRSRRATADKFLLGAALCFLIAITGQSAPTTAFTFQGRLSDSGTPANGNYDLQLKLFTTETINSGTQIGGTITRPAVKVTNGVFTVQLDFTAAAFPGADRFLEIGIKPAGSGSAFTILQPRQPITPTPYAIYSASSATATHASTASLATNATNATNATTATNANTAANATKLNNIAANQYVLTTDSRLTNARAPTPGSANYIQNRTTQQASSNFNILGNGTLFGKLSVGQASPNTYPFSVVGKTGTGENQTAGIFLNNSPDTGVTIKNTTANGAAWTLFSSGTGSVLNSFPTPSPSPGATPNPNYGNGVFSIYDVAAKKPRLMIQPGGTVLIPSGLFIDTSAGIGMDAETRSGGEAVYAECRQSGNNCYAIEGYAPTGDYAGYMYGGKGVYVESDDAGQPALDGNAYGANSYGVSGESATYRGGYFKSDSNVLYSLYVDDVDGPTQGTAALNVRGTIRGEGNLVIGGSKAGYVVDIMQNVDSAPLEPGDVVIIVGSSAPVLGEIPVVTVKKATSSNDTGVAGIVDEVWYAPDTASKTAYEAQENAARTAMNSRKTTTIQARANNTKPVHDPAPEMKITDAQGTLHVMPNAANAGPGGYVSVVTLGAYKRIKVDASFGAIKPGDVLTTSTTPGHAMKAAPVVVSGIEIYRPGTILGKALEPLAQGTGVIKVFVSMR